MRNCLTEPDQIEAASTEFGPIQGRLRPKFGPPKLARTEFGPTATNLGPVRSQPYADFDRGWTSLPSPPWELGSLRPKTGSSRPIWGSARHKLQRLRPSLNREGYVTPRHRDRASAGTQRTLQALQSTDAASPSRVRFRALEGRRSLRVGLGPRLLAVVQIRVRRFVGDAVPPPGAAPEGCRVGSGGHPARATQPNNWEDSGHMLGVNPSHANLRPPLG